MADTRIKKSKRTRGAESGSVRVTFPARISVWLDDDVREMLNASAEKVDWANQAHAINAGLRQVMKKFAPATLRIRIHPFDQLVFAKKSINKRRS